MKRSIIRQVGDDQYQAAVVETHGVHVISATRRDTRRWSADHQDWVGTEGAPVPWADPSDDHWTGPVRTLSERATLEAERDSEDCHVDAPIERKQWLRLEWSDGVPWFRWVRAPEEPVSVGPYR